MVSAIDGRTRPGRNGYFLDVGFAGRPGQQRMVLQREIRLAHAWLANSHEALRVCRVIEQPSQ
jgi:hypothetical protein